MWNTVPGVHRFIFVKYSKIFRSSSGSMHKDSSSSAVSPLYLQTLGSIVSLDLFFSIVTALKFSQIPSIFKGLAANLTKS